MKKTDCVRRRSTLGRLGVALVRLSDCHAHSPLVDRCVLTKGPWAKRQAWVYSIRQYSMRTAMRQGYSSVDPPSPSILSPALDYQFCFSCLSTPTQYYMCVSSGKKMNAMFQDDPRCQERSNGSGSGEIARSSIPTQCATTKKGPGRIGVDRYMYLAPTVLS
jgi:hypothetical protein